MRCRSSWRLPDDGLNLGIMKTGDLSSWIQRYFQEYLVRQRNVSPATVAGYRDTFKL